MGVNPELPGVNFYITTCLHGVDLRFTPRCYLCKPWHGVDLRFTPRCYLCKPWPADSPVYGFVASPDKGEPR